MKTENRCKAKIESLRQRYIDQNADMETVYDLESAFIVGAISSLEWAVEIEEDRIGKMDAVYQKEYDLYCKVVTENRNFPIMNYREFVTKIYIGDEINQMLKDKSNMGTGAGMRDYIRRKIEKVLAESRLKEPKTLQLSEAITMVITLIEDDKPIPNELIELIAGNPDIDISSKSIEDVFRYLINEDIEITEDLLIEAISVDEYFTEFSGDRNGIKVIEPNFEKWLIDRKFNGEIDIGEWIKQNQNDLFEYEDLYMENLFTDGRCIYLSGLDPWSIYFPVRIKRSVK